MGIFDGALRRMVMGESNTTTADESGSDNDWAVCNECGGPDLSSEMIDDLCRDCSRTEPCKQCGAETLTLHLDEGLCDNCFENQGNLDAGGKGPTRYCCGAIYENGESECRSCGEPL